MDALNSEETTFFLNKKRKVLYNMNRLTSDVISIFLYWILPTLLGMRQKQREKLINAREKETFLVETTSKQYEF